jgi:DNA polymerase II small subunit/DNA polymerase delta subunit B
LEKAKKSLFEENRKDVEFFKTDQQIDQAGLAYEDIVKSFNYKNEKVDKIINELENWNQKNREYNERN